MDNALYHFGTKGMRWGVRRYQNEDGSLTEAGQRRYERDQRENSSKNKGNKVVKADPNRWVKEDLARSKKVLDASSDMANKLKNVTSDSIKDRKKNRADLSKMSDQQLREKINRELLERQYNDMFTPQKAAKGRERALKFLETFGSVVGIGSSALGIALAIKDLRG